MTIAIAVAVPDGIALAADTQTTWSQVITKAVDKATGNEFELAKPIQQPVGWSRMAKKLFPLEMNGHQYAIATAGAAQLNQKSMYAVFRSAASQYSGDGSCGDVTQYFEDCLKKELAIQHGCPVEELHNRPVTACDFIIAGYEDNDVAKPFLESHLVFSGTVDIDDQKNTSGHWRRWSNTSITPRYQSCWIGRSEFISHIVNHSRNDLPPIQGQYSMMTLSDAVDYTVFLVSYTCDFQRFAIMVPDCGRPITSAKLTPESYEEQIIE